MSRLNPSRLAPSLVVAGALALLAGCGGSAVDPNDTGPLGSTAGPTPTTATPTPTHAPTRTRTPRPTPTPTADTGGDGDAEGDNEPATSGGGICRYVGAEEVGAVLGTTVTGSAVPGETGCKFSQGGARGMSVTILDKTVASAGGMDGAKSEANSAVEGTPQDLSGIGSAAFVITGSMFGGPEVNAAGAVQVGSRIISVYYVQHTLATESKVRTIEVNLLKLVVHEAP